MALAFHVVRVIFDLRVIFLQTTMVSSDFFLFVPSFIEM